VPIRTHVSKGPLEREVVRQFLPFAAMGVLAFATVALPPEPSDWRLVGVAAVLTVAIALSGLLVPWSEVPRWTWILPSISYFAVVGLLREAQGGSDSGYAALAILPVVWMALTLSRREVAIGVAAGVALFVVPLSGVGSGTYSNADWRRAIIWIGVALIVGFSIETLVRRARREAAEARRRAEEVAESERTLAAIAAIVREAAASADVRDLVCRATVDVAGGAVATIVEPEGAEWLVVTGSAGLRGEAVRVRMGDDPSGSEIAFTSGERLFVPDVQAHERLAQRLAASSPDVVSALYEPIVREGRTIGVLAVGWTERVDTLDSRRARAVQLLALEAGAALERADLVAQLRRSSLTDELTGLPNRRSWDEGLEAAVRTATRTAGTLSVALVDLDHFKDYNDTRGHQAGDRLLKSAAASWRSVLRTGDMLARYGGEEFAVLLPECALEEARHVLERLRGMTPEDVTCSVGVAEWDGEESGASVVERADIALYHAKDGGRDLLVAAEPPPSIEDYRPTA
jgi:diguanylate cyclase (GGDEF)-like protein